MSTTVTRFVEFDTGHRVARHESKCSHLHGHRYKLTVEVEGEVRNDDSPEHGMVIDFARVKDALNVIHDEWDHRFLIGSDDPLEAHLAGSPGVVVLEVQPTAENLASLAFARLTELLAPLTVKRVSMQETTSCEAHVTR